MRCLRAPREKNWSDLSIVERADYYKAEETTYDIGLGLYAFTNPGRINEYPCVLTR